MDLAQQGLINDEFYRGLKLILLTVKELTQTGHDETARGLLRVFSQTLQVPQVNRYITPDASQQLIDLAQKVLDGLLSPRK